MKISVDEAPASRLMDAEVAMILGWSELSWWRWTEWAGKEWFWNLYPPGGKGFDNLEPRRPNHQPDLNLYCYVPEFSYDITAAWELVEILVKILESGQHKETPAYSLKLEYFPIENPWRVSFGLGRYGEGWFISCAETLALAICRAFLKAQGITEIEMGE